MAQQLQVATPSVHIQQLPPRASSLFVPESVESDAEEAETPSTEETKREEGEIQLSSLERETDSLQKRPVQETLQQASGVTAHEEKRPRTQVMVTETTHNAVLQGICSHLQQHGQEQLHRLQQEQLLPAAASVDTVTPDTLA